MTHDEELFLHEAVLLLALHDEEGTVAFGSMYSYAVGGAILAELLLRGRVAADEAKGKSPVRVIDSTPTGEPVLDEALERIGAAKAKAAPSVWVGRFANMQSLKDRIAQELSRRGVLRADEKEVLFIFTRKVYPTVDPGPEERLIERMREAIFTDEPEVDPRTVVLVSLADGVGLLESLFDKAELKMRKERLERLTRGEIAGRAARKVIEEMQVILAVMPAITAATIAASSAASTSC